MAATLGVFCIMLAFIFLAQPPDSIVILLGILFLLFLAAIIIVAKAIESIYRTVLYDYAVNGRIARNFAPELITNAIKTKK